MAIYTFILPCHFNNEDHQHHYDMLVDQDIYPLLGLMTKSRYSIVGYLLLHPSLVAQWLLQDA